VRKILAMLAATALIAVPLGASAPAGATTAPLNLTPIAHLAFKPPLVGVQTQPVFLPNGQLPVDNSKDGTIVEMNPDGSGQSLSASGLAGPGAMAVSVTATTPGGTTSPLSYTYQPPPSGLGLSSKLGHVADALTITGHDLDAATKVTFGSTVVHAASFTAAPTSTQIQLLVPSHLVGKVKVTVTTPGGTAGAGTFSYIPPGPALPRTSGRHPAGR
jgi:hypothetical protein